jgi:hypothetical protein
MTKKHQNVWRGLGIEFPATDPDKPASPLDCSFVRQKTKGRLGNKQECWKPRVER